MIQFKSQAELVVLQNLKNEGICQLSKCFSNEENLLMFRKTYSHLDKPIALSEIFVNERIKDNLNSNSNIVTYYGYYNEKISDKKQNEKESVLSRHDNSQEHLNLLFEFSETGSLYDYLINSKEFYEEFSNDLSAIRKFCIQIIEALIKIHQLGIVHNDLKLENILLFKNQQPSGLLESFNYKICDFNSSLFIDSDDNIVNVFSSDDNYTFPFPIPFEKPSFKFDFWCLGFLLLKILNLTHNFEILKNNFFEFLTCLKGKTYRNDLRLFEFKSLMRSKSKKEFPIIKDLIEKLLEMDVDQRLDDENIFSHPFFYISRNVDVFCKKFNRKKGVILKFQKKIRKLRKMIKDIEEKSFRKTFSVFKLKKRMLKYAKILNKIKCA